LHQILSSGGFGFHVLGHELIRLQTADRDVALIDKAVVEILLGFCGLTNMGLKGAIVCLSALEALVLRHAVWKFAPVEAQCWLLQSLCNSVTQNPNRADNAVCLHKLDCVKWLLSISFLPTFHVDLLAPALNLLQALIVPFEFYNESMPTISTAKPFDTQVLSARLRFVADHLLYVCMSPAPSSAPSDMARVSDKAQKARPQSKSTFGETRRFAHEATNSQIRVQCMLLDMLLRVLLELQDTLGFIASFTAFSDAGINENWLFSLLQVSRASFMSAAEASVTQLTSFQEQLRAQSAEGKSCDESNQLEQLQQTHIPWNVRLLDFELVAIHVLRLLQCYMFDSARPINGSLFVSSLLPSLAALHSSPKVCTLLLSIALRKRLGSVPPCDASIDSPEWSSWLSPPLDHDDTFTQDSVIFYAPAVELLLSLLQSALKPGIPIDTESVELDSEETSRIFVTSSSSHSSELHEPVSPRSNRSSTPTCIQKNSDLVNQGILANNHSSSNAPTPEISARLTSSATSSSSYRSISQRTNPISPSSDFLPPRPPIAPSQRTNPRSPSSDFFPPRSPITPSISPALRSRSISDGGALPAAG
jgi:hypothetical protein